MVVFWQVGDPVRAGVIGGDVVLGPDSFISSMDLMGRPPSLQLYIKLVKLLFNSSTNETTSKILQLAHRRITRASHKDKQ